MEPELERTPSGAQNVVLVLVSILGSTPELGRTSESYIYPSFRGLWWWSFWRVRVRVGAGKEKGSLWVILAPGPGGNGGGQFLGRGASRARGLRSVRGPGCGQVSG